MFRAFKIQNFTGTTFIEQQEISPGIFIANTIAYESTAMIRVINTKEKIAVIPNEIKSHTDIKQYNIFKIEQTEQSTERTRELEKILVKSTPTEKIHTLMTLCKKNTDIFTLQNDKMTTNNFYEQKIRMMNDAPVYTKNYRIPHKTEKRNRQTGEQID